VQRHTIGAAEAEQFLQLLLVVKASEAAVFAEGVVIDAITLAKLARRKLGSLDVGLLAALPMVS
jgi:hypothetical protein